ncbi:MAG TPA: hypothetical protein VGK73_07765 [Polyangiaceae bacterium]
MSRANEPAYPVPTETVLAAAIVNPSGLTIREAFAMAAMQGFLSTYHSSNCVLFSEVAEQSVRQADALLAALSKVQP